MHKIQFLKIKKSEHWFLYLKMLLKIEKKELNKII